MVTAFFEPLKDEAIVRHQLSQKALIIPDDDVTALDVPLTPGKAILVEEVESPDGDLQNELLLEGEAPRALIVEDDPDDPVNVPTPPRAIPIEDDPDETPIEPAPPKAIPVEDDLEDILIDPNAPEVPPLRELPEVIDPDITPAADPADVPEPPKAIPVE
jgi:hypothetical protein